MWRSMLEILLDVVGMLTLGRTTPQGDAWREKAGYRGGAQSPCHYKITEERR